MKPRQMGLFEWQPRCSVVRPEASAHMQTDRNGRDLAGWLTREHDWMDARLAGILLQTIWGADSDVRREFETYRSELLTHLSTAEDRFFSMLAGVDDKIAAVERLEWQSHKRDLRLAFTAIERQMSQPRRSSVYGPFDALRRVLRRHRRHEERLLALTGPQREPPDAETDALTEAFL